jgi:ribonuclease P protein component
MTDHRFPKSLRLLKPAEFDRVFTRRRSQADGMLLIYGCENDLATSRLGLVVSKKCGDAVTRNRWKRCIREAFRLLQQEIPQGIDFVALPRAGAAPAMPRIRKSFEELARRVASQLAKGATTPTSQGESP